VKRSVKIAIITMGALPALISTSLAVIYFSPDSRQAFLGSRTYEILADSFNDLRPYANFSNSASCVEDLKSLMIEFEPVGQMRNRSCVVRHGVRIARIGDTIISPNAVMTCSLAKSLLTWEREVQNTAQEVLGVRISEIRHVGTYNCRDLRTMPRIRSEHAYANAIDIVSFSSTEGKRYAVRGGWHGNSAVSLFLKSIAAKACQLFSVTLTPNSNPAHADHFHLDNGLFMGGDC
jgi:hypothetical protein